MSTASASPWPSRWSRPMASSGRSSCRGAWRVRWPESTGRVLRGAAHEASAALARAYSHRAAETRASTDALTGLPNRHYFDEFVGLLAQRRRAGDRVGILMIDIDKFKVLNDRHGHATGDEVLRAVASAIVSAVREDDVPARFGGEEFVVLLRDPDPGVAVEVGERIRSAVRALDLARFGVRRRQRLGRRRRRRRTGPVDRGPDRNGRSGAVPRQAGRPRPGHRRLNPGPGRLRASDADPPRAANRRPATRRTIAGMPRRVARTDPPPAPPATGDVDPPVDADLLDAADADAADQPLTNGDLARVFHDIGDMLEVKGELVFKTVAYHRAADAIGRSPIDLVAAYRSGSEPQDPRRRGGDQRQDEGARHHRPDGVLRPAPGRGPARPRRAAADPGARPQDRSPDLDRARHRVGRGPAAGRAGRDAALAARAVGPDRAARPRGDRAARIGARSDAPASGRGAHRGADGGAGGRARASSASSRPVRSDADASRSATSTSSPRPRTARR